MKKTKKDTDNKTSELESQLKRALADYANLQKRTEEEKKAVVKFGNVVLIAKFLDILDHLEEAQKTINSEGLELVIKKFKDNLDSEGVNEISTQGEVFDPVKHEGIATVEGEKDGEIAQVLQKGYELDGKVIRPARVRVTTAATVKE